MNIIRNLSRDHDGELYLGQIWSDGVKVFISPEASQFSLEKTDSHVIAYVCIIRCNQNVSYKHLSRHTVCHTIQISPALCPT